MSRYVCMYACIAYDSVRTHTYKHVVYMCVCLWVSLCARVYVHNSCINDLSVFWNVYFKCQLHVILNHISLPCELYEIIYIACHKHTSDIMNYIPASRDIVALSLVRSLSPWRHLPKSTTESSLCKSSHLTHGVATCCAVCSGAVSAIQPVRFRWSSAESPS